MFKSKNTHCVVCKKIIQPGENTFVNLKNPKRKGITEIKAYLRLEARFYCTDCVKVSLRNK
ncbi:hypothetical protein [Brochothrix thermosphacta]|uniref:hypothetical protein n=1 Tax=Brochothrix thermosphacta TaxID=2756 RepID=UPI00083FCE6C|nr:hypothetical protein [Brochothrix thermosphacta]ODJ64796.1 hypothetical protein BFR35_06630 [Brochothrix thermosphacta]